MEPHGRLLNTFQIKGVGNPILALSPDTVVILTYRPLLTTVRNFQTDLTKLVLMRLPTPAQTNKALGYCKLGDAPNDTETIQDKTSPRLPEGDLLQYTDLARPTI